VASNGDLPVIIHVQKRVLQGGDVWTGQIVLWSDKDEVIRQAQDSVAETTKIIFLGGTRWCVR